MLSRIQDCDKKIEKMKREKEAERQEENWDWRQHFILLGSDVTALFPSLSAEKTARAVRNQLEKSKVKWQNIDNRWLTLYIKLNESRISKDDLKEIKKLLPERKSKKGKSPSFSSIDIEKRFIWPRLIEYLSESQKSKLLGLAIEQAIIFFFKNFTYTFGGRIYIQDSGGPIGARLTMAVARLVMQEWKEGFDMILEKSNIEDIMSGLYVDDGRGVQRILEYGERFIESEGVIKVVEDKEKEDKENNINRQELTRNEMLKAMNSVNTDLQFTMEICSDFEGERLPTLSFSIWQANDGLKHTYFEKTMRNQILLMERTSMSRQSLYSILSNELNRRLEVLDEKISKEEMVEVVDKFIQQLVNSEFKPKQIREIVISGLTGYSRKEERRKRLGKPKYRSGKDSLETRVEKKLTEKYNWFRNVKKKKEKDDDINNERDTKRDEEGSDNIIRKFKQNKETGRMDKSKKEEAEEMPKSVLFVQNTLESALAKKLKRMILELKPWTRINIKVVERSGERLEDILHRSDPWEKRDCERKDCMPCYSFSKDENLGY